MGVLEGNFPGIWPSGVPIRGIYSKYTRYVYNTYDCVIFYQA